MSDLPGSVWAVLLATVGSAFLGSAHCLGMCGGISALASMDAKSALSYQLGRWMGYATLGALAALLGSTLTGAELPTELHWLSFALIGLALISNGVSLWRGTSGLSPLSGKRVGGALSGLLRPVNALPSVVRSLLIGLVTAALPCAWLYSFVLIALASRDPWMGAGVMSGLWLGSAPPLLVAGVGGAGIRRWATQRGARQLWARRALALVLVLAGVSNLSARSPWRRAETQGGGGAGGGGSELICHPGSVEPSAMEPKSVRDHRD